MFVIAFETDNSPFVDDYSSEVANTLRDIARYVELGAYPDGKEIRDSNGNTVGAWSTKAHAYSLAEIKNGTGFTKGIRFAEVTS